MARFNRGLPRLQPFFSRNKVRGTPPDLQGNPSASSGAQGRFVLNKNTLRAKGGSAGSAAGIFTTIQKPVLNTFNITKDPRGVSYSIILYDLVSQAQKEEIPIITGFSFSKILNNPGTFSATVPLDHPKATRANLDPGKTAIFVVRENIIAWSGILDAVKPDWHNRKLTITGTGFLSALNRRYLHGRRAMQFASAAGAFTYYPKSDVDKINVIGVPDNSQLFNNVDEVTLDLTDDVIGTDQVGGYRTHFQIPVGDFAGLTIASLRVTALISSVTGFAFVSPWLSIGGVDYTVNTFTRAPNYGVAFCSATWPNNPATNIAWTPADVATFSNTNAAGVRFIQPFTLSDTIIWQMYVDVTWEANPSGAIFWDNVDQLEIARDMIRHTQAEPGGDLHLNLDTTTSGRPVTQHDYSWEYKQIGQMLSTLAKADNGFDYDVESVWDNTLSPPRPKQTFRTYYPKKGARLLDVRFDRNNLLDFAVTTDGTKIANRVDVVGTGQGAQMLTSTRSDPSQWGGTPLWEKVVTQKSIDQQATLDSLAQQGLQLSETAQELPQITVRPDTTVAPVGTFTVGDEIYVYMNEGYIQLDKIMRVQRIDVSVDANLNESQKVTFADSLVDTSV